MMKKIRMNCTVTLDETFADFLLSAGQRACGKDAGKLFLPMESRGAALGHGDGRCRAQKADLDAMIVSMRDAGLSQTVSTATRAF